MECPSDTSNSINGCMPEAHPCPTMTNPMHSQNGYMYSFSEWRSHSKLAAMSFPFSNKTKMFNENVNPIPIKKIYLGQCKARPFNFVRVFYFLFFIFYFSALTDIGFSALKSRLIQIEPCTAVGPPLVLAMVHWPPMNKFACKLHGYIVYFIWWEANHIPSHSHAQNGIAIPVHFKCFRVCGKLFTCLVLLRQCQCFYCDAVGVSLYWIPHLPGTQKYKITISFHLLGDVDISASTNRSFVGHKV